jgi:acyl dehydratase
MPVALTRDMQALKLLGDIDWAGLVHGEQEVRIGAPLAVEGRLAAVSRIAAVHDKGRAALVTVVTEARDTAGKSLFTTTSRLYLRGEGGWGGDRGPSTGAWVPERDPDATVTQATSRQQALIYRLSGDRNPLHSDPAFAVRAGFDRPILHGLATFGFAGRALLQAVCGGDPDRFAAMRARFTAPVVPGDELTTDIWYDGPDARFQTRRGDGTVVLGSGHLTTRS